MSDNNPHSTNLQTRLPFHPPALIQYLCRRPRHREATKGSKVGTCLYTLGKYSLPWFPHCKQPCEVSDDPRARMRTINRKLVSSKLHPIIIREQKKHRQAIPNCAKMQSDNATSTTTDHPTTALTHTWTHTSGQKYSKTWEQRRTLKQTSLFTNDKQNLCGKNG